MKDDKHYKDWEILYKDDANIYFGPVSRSFFSKKETITTYAFMKLPYSELDTDIPLYSSGNLNQIIKDSLNSHFDKYDKKGHFDMESIQLILRGDSINYQIQGKMHSYHFERGMDTYKSLVLTDKRLNVLDVLFFD